MQTLAPPDVVPAVPRPSRRRVLVVYEPGRSGEAVLAIARELAVEERAALTVAGVVPQAAHGRGCIGSPSAYNSAVRDAVERELAEAREGLREAGDRAVFRLLVEGKDPPLQDWSAESGFDVILLPARRRPIRSLKHPAAAGLKRRTGADVRVIGPRVG
jgi:hypothetical protein